MPTLTRADDGVYVLDLGDGENRFTPEWVSQVGGHLDTVTAQGRPVALVTTATGKFFSNGLDLDGLLADPGTADSALRDVQVLLARFLSLGVPTVAAIQGHAFAAGAMLTLCHDVRVMREDRGFWCLPEIDIDIPFTTGMSELITAKLTGPVAHEAMVTGERYPGPAALASGIVHEVASEADLLPRAVALAAAQGAHAGATMHTIKRQMYANADEALRHGPAHLAAPAAPAASQARAVPGSTTEELVAVDGGQLYVRVRRAAGKARYTVLLLHGWPGTADDWDTVVAQAQGTAMDDVDIVVPDLRGFGRSAPAATDDPAGPGTHLADLATVLAATAPPGPVVAAGYDLGATLAQGLARTGAAAGLLLGCPPYPGIGERRFEPQVQAQLWYQQLHQQAWASALIARDRQGLEIYLRHFYTHWWGAGEVDEAHFQSVVDLYHRPGAFQGSIDWYRARSASRSKEAATVPAPLSQPTEVLWGTADPVNPVRFADRLLEHFPASELTVLDGVGHFVPLEAPGQVVQALVRLDARVRAA